ncbi:peptidylprolyl isomerase [Kordia jejudonensis]|uniref:peptidylprolyl isomerase n=1 Tax=Kordia jejudonensis TaxID=1348245 RepID=UPI0006295CED|nr:peptidylprolyl isomerase [Kordia jejudonensis]
MKHSIQLFLTLFVSLTTFAQSEKDNVLFTIEGEPTYVSEFSRVYKKNLDIIDEKDQKEINEYFDLFVEYKLKLKEAYNLNLNEKASYKKELAGYKKQLSKNYLTDNTVTEKLVQEAYDRLQKEVKASHILIKVSAEASPSDTLAAYEKIMKLRKSIIDGADFGDVAAQNSDDPSAKGNQTIPANKGNLGYFSAFRMVYPFETAAFNTPKGEISMPIRTQYGYHIIKVTDVRENAGEITVAHILLLNKEDSENKENPEEKIKDIYSQIKAGSDFGAMAKRYSEDRSSGVNNGKLPKFGRGRLRSKKFEEVAFSLDNVGQISAPFQSEFGWHIVQLVSKHTQKSFEDEKYNLEQRIKRDKRANVINSSVVKKIKKLYTITENPEAKKDFQTLAATDNFFTRSWQLPTDPAFLNKTLIQIKDTKITYNDFATYLSKNKSRVMQKNIDPKAFINANYAQYIDGKLLAFYENDLENVNEEFAAIYGEYRDGLLLFDLMEQQIWEKAKNDTLGLEAYFNANKENYKWKNRVEAVIATCTDANVAKEVKQLLAEGKPLDEIKNTVNKDAKVNVIFTMGVFEEGHRNLPKEFQLKKGVSDVIKEAEGDYTIIKVNEVIPADYKALSEIKGKVISDYQVHLEKEWIQQLKENYKVKINKKVYRKLKKLVK